MTEPHQVIPQEDGKADHAAPGLLDSLPFRTVLQGLAIDLSVAGALVIYDATSDSAVDWRLMLASVGRTLVQTAASWWLKRFRPVTGES